MKHPTLFRPPRIYRLILDFARSHPAGFTVADIPTLSRRAASTNCSHLRLKGALQLVRPGRPGRFGNAPATYKPA